MSGGGGTDRWADRVEGSVAILNNGRATHTEWIAHLIACPGCPDAEVAGSIEDQQEAVRRYDEVLAVLLGVAADLGAAVARADRAEAALRVTTESLEVLHHLDRDHCVGEGCTIEAAIGRARAALAGSEDTEDPTGDPT